MMMLAADIAAQKDITNEYIANPTLANGTAGWTVKNFNSPVRGANSGAYAVEAYAGWAGLSVTSYSLTQKITLPKGSYRLANNAFFRQGEKYNTNASKSLAYLKAGAKRVAVKTLGSATADSYPDNQAEGADRLGDDTYSNTVDFDIANDNTTIEIGITGTFSQMRSWCITAGFRLTDLNAKDDRNGLIAALERFENHYNLADGTDYSRQTMSADAWATLIAKVNAVNTALDDVSQATSYGTIKDALIAQMDATDASLRLFKSYKAMADGVCSVCSGITAADSEMDTDASEQAAIADYNTAFVDYATTQSDNFSVSAFLGANLDFSAAEGEALDTDNSNNIHAVSDWEVAYADADTWTVLQTKQSENTDALYMRKNWGSAATTLTVAKQKMLPVGKYTLSFKWNSNMENMTNRSQYKIGTEYVAIGKTTSGAEELTYNFEITGQPQPFDLVFSFQKTGTDNTPAQMVVDDIVLTYVPTVITLADNAENADAIRENAGKRGVVTLQGRTLIKDGSWNTLCLPFSMTAEQVTAQLAPAALMELDIESNAAYAHQTGLDGNTLYLNFKDATAIAAGKPYIIKWTGGGENIANPVFRSVTVINGSPAGVHSADRAVTFQGTYDPVSLTKDDPSNLYLGDGNTLYYPNVENFKVNAFRAYFHLSDPNATARFALNFGGETTGISLSASQSAVGNCQLFDLQGRPVGSSPLRKGIYISAGKTIIKK